MVRDALDAGLPECWLERSLEDQRADVAAWLCGASELDLLRLVSLVDGGRFDPPERTLMRAHVAYFARVRREPWATAVPAGPGWRVAALLEKVRASSRAGLRLRELSGEVGLSSTHAGRLFRRWVGIAFHEYALATRMWRGRGFIRDPRLSEKEVSAALGYSDPANFCRDFRRVFGTTLMAYRSRKALPAVRRPVEGPWLGGEL